MKKIILRVKNMNNNIGETKNIKTPEKPRNENPKNPGGGFSPMQP